jgi:hypothetical protein
MGGRGGNNDETTGDWRADNFAELVPNLHFEEALTYYNKAYRHPEHVSPEPDGPAALFGFIDRFIARPNAPT